MSANRKLHTAAESFANGIAHLLRETISRDVHLVAIESEPDEVYIGTASTVAVAKANPIKIQTGVPFAYLWLNVGYNLRLDVDKYLTVWKSVFGLRTGAAAEHELLRFDYERMKKNVYPDSHLQVFGDNAPLLELFSLMGIPKTRMDHLHLPMGGRRYRPILEDLIEFLIHEKLVRMVSEDQGAALALLDERRREFHKKQLRAAIRRDVQTAIEALDGEGYDVKRRQSVGARVAKLLPGPRGSDGSTRPRRGH